jgi:hypothetical protein
MLVLVPGVLLALAAGTRAVAQAPAIAPAALARFTAMADFLNAHQSYSFVADASFDDAVNATDKVQFHATVTSTVHRPDQLKVQYDGDRRAADFYDDGKTFTLYDKRANRYGAIPATGSIESMMQKLTSKYRFSVPLADLYSPELISGVRAKILRGYVVGPSVVGGVPTEHLAFFGEKADLELWIEDGSMPVPRKMVITYKKLPGSPQYTATFPKWDFSAPPDAAFSFVPPPNSVRINFLEDAR